MNYNHANDLGACAGSAPRDQRPHEIAIQNCHEQLHKLENLIGEADRVLAPVVLPQPPQTEKQGVGLNSCGPMASEAVNAVGHVASRVAALTERLANIVGRVNV